VVTNMGTIVVRPWEPGDDAGIVEMYNREEPQAAPRAVEAHRGQEAEVARQDDEEQWVAVAAGRVVGVGSFGPAWWTGRLGDCTAQLLVDHDYRGRGIGSRLSDILDSRLAAHGATRLLAWVRTDSTPGRCFAARRGFTETGQVIDEYRLRVEDASLEAYQGLEDQLRGENVRIASLNELESSDETVLRGLQHLWADSGGTPPDAQELADSFDSWRARVVEGAGLAYETHWVALHAGRPVGMTFLKRLRADAAENDYTAVAPSFRGRGIAQALKVRAIRWARENGVRWFFTSSEIDNARMIAINERLGYVRTIRKVEVAREL